MAPKMPAAQTSSKSDRLCSEAVFWILSSFSRKPMNTKVGDNFVAHNLDAEFALFGVQTWVIWCWQGRRIRKNLDEADLMETKYPSLPRKISCKASWRTPQDSPRAYIQPLGHPRRGDRSIHSSESRRHEGEAPGGSRRPPQVLELPRRWLRPCPSCHGWSCVVKP
jgi:hypothetical protein